MSHLHNQYPSVAYPVSDRVLLKKSKEKTLKLEPHPIANKLPWMNEDEYRSFKDGIKEHGYDKRHPITIYEGKILDGRHRWKACKELGIEPVFENFKENGRTALRFVIDENVNRRHLNTSQRTVTSLFLYDDIKSLFLSKNYKGKDTEFKDQCNRNRAKHVAKIFGVGRSSVEAALRIRKHCPDLLAEIMSGNLTLAKAVKQAPKVGRIKEIQYDALALQALKEFDPSSMTMPVVYDSYEKFMGDHRRTLNDAGYMMQVVMCSRKIYVQIIKQNEHFKPWGNVRSEHDYRLAVVAAMRGIKI